MTLSSVASDAFLCNESIRNLTISKLDLALLSSGQPHLDVGERIATIMRDPVVMHDACEADARLRVFVQQAGQQMLQRIAHKDIRREH